MAQATPIEPGSGAIVWLELSCRDKRAARLWPFGSVEATLDEVPVPVEQPFAGL
jgi:hypothetical protein